MGEKTGGTAMRARQVKFTAHEVPGFAMRFRGYHRREVDDYLDFLVDAYVALYQKYQALQTEVAEYRQQKQLLADMLLALGAAAELREQACAPGDNAQEADVFTAVCEADIEALLASLQEEDGGEPDVPAIG